MTNSQRYLATAFGLRWQSDLPLEHFVSIEGREGESGGADVRISRVAALAERASPVPVRRGQLYADGTRFPWEQEAVFDTWNGNRVDYCPGPDWRGVLPTGFYGTVVALLLAWRGTIPLHACAVEIGGKAMLIAGESGAGKSSLMAGLLDLGAPLVSDDLTAVEIGDGAVEALPGRTTIRLGTVTAQWSDGVEFEPPSPRTQGKHVIRPSTRTRAERLPVGGLLMLGEKPGEMSALTRSAVLARHLFRPVWLAALPGHRVRQQALLTVASRVPITGFAALDAGGEQVHRARARDAYALLETLAGLMSFPATRR